MSENDNTVNIKNRDARYHHGDLRSALIEEGLSLLGQKAVEDLSLREIARNAGVSATAVYRHFPDKAALMQAMCEVTSRALGVAFQDAMAAADSPREAFDAMGRAYVRFALAHPSEFRLMMTATPPDVRRTHQGPAEGDPFLMLSESLNGLLPPDTPEQLKLVKRLQAWSMVHGLAMLMLDGQVPADEDLIGPVVSSTFL